MAGAAVGVGASAAVAAGEPVSSSPPAISGEPVTGLWDEIRSPLYTYVGIADGNGAWNLVLVGGCPAATDATRACGLTGISGL